MLKFRILPRIISKINPFKVAYIDILVKHNFKTISKLLYSFDFSDVFKAFLRVRIKAVDLPKGVSLQIFTEYNIQQHVRVNSIRFVPFVF